MPRQFSPAEIQLARNNLLKARALIETAAGAFLDLGAVLNTLEKGGLFNALGTYLSFRHFLRKEKLIPYSTAKKYMLAAATYSGPNARKLGVDKLIEVLRLAAWEGDEANDIVENNAVIDDRPVDDHTVDSLEALHKANEKRREELERQKEELRNDPALAEQHKSARSAARRLESILEKTIAGPDAETRAVRHESIRGLRIRLELSLEDTLELIEILKNEED